MILVYSALAVVRRWKRNLLTLLAMLVGTASVVAMVGISESSALATAQKLAAYDSAHLEVRLQSYSWDWSEEYLTSQLAQLPEVKAGGTLTISEIPNLTLSKTAEASGADPVYVAVVSPAGLTARGAEVTASSFYTPSPGREAEAVIMLGRTLARDLGISIEDGANRLYLNGQLVTVAGIIKDGPESSLLSLSVMVAPESRFLTDHLSGQRYLDVLVEPGAADIVGKQLKPVLDPAAPQEVNVAIPPSPAVLKAQLTQDMQAMTRVTLIVMAVATSFGLIMTMQISVWERRREIGISRALGASRAKVALDFLTESAVLGCLGAATGFLAGVLVSSIAVWVNGWELTLPPSVLLLLPLGAVVGTISGVVPAWNASRVEPLELLA